jgi:methionine synthase II (cobalamin-independent)
LPPQEPFVTRRLQVERDIVADEYGFLKANAHARAKYSIPAPSWHRIFWHPDYSTGAYPTSDDFIRDVARLTREHIVDRLVELGCDYIQLDAPNYAQWHIDPGNRAAFEEHGHDMAHELVARVEEATRYVPLDRLAVSPQCGFASGEIARTMTLAEQEAKLRLIGDIARRVWR